jgi:hypothetical protein
MGGARVACNIEGLWAQISFEAKLPDDKLLSMRQDFQKAWDTREEISGEMTSREAMVESLEKLNETYGALVDTVKKKLTEDELAELQPWLDEQSSLRERMRERMERIAEMRQRGGGGRAE